MTKGSSINDVTQFWDSFWHSLFPTSRSLLLSTVVTKSLTPSPLRLRQIAAVSVNLNVVRMTCTLKSKFKMTITDLLHDRLLYSFLWRRSPPRSWWSSQKWDIGNSPRRGLGRRTWSSWRWCQLEDQGAFLKLRQAWDLESRLIKRKNLSYLILFHILGTFFHIFSSLL